MTWFNPDFIPGSLVPLFRSLQPLVLRLGLLQTSE